MEYLAGMQSVVIRKCSVGINDISYEVDTGYATELS